MPTNVITSSEEEKTHKNILNTKIICIREDFDLIIAILYLILQGYWKKKFRMCGELLSDDVKEKVSAAELELKDECITEVWDGYHLNLYTIHMP